MNYMIGKELAGWMDQVDFPPGLLTECDRLSNLSLHHIGRRMDARLASLWKLVATLRRNRERLVFLVALL